MIHRSREVASLCSSKHTEARTARVGVGVATPRADVVLATNLPLSLSLSLSFSTLGSLLSIRVSPAPVKSSTWHQREDIRRGGRLFPAKRRRPSLVVAPTRARFRESARTEDTSRSPPLPVSLLSAPQDGPPPRGETGIIQRPRDAPATSVVFLCRVNLSCRGETVKIYHR